jgi:hypothetical protein
VIGRVFDAGYLLGLTSITRSMGIHALAIGAISGSILEVVTRVALEHTGRPLSCLRMLFVLEKQWVNLSSEQRFEQRQLHARPLIDDLAAWLAKSLPTIAPKSQLGRAMLYLHRQWDKCRSITIRLRIRSGHL